MVTKLKTLLIIDLIVNIITDYLKNTMRNLLTITTNIQDVL